MSRLKFVYDIYIATTPKILWNALTDGKITQKYFFGRRVESTWEVGSPVVYWEKGRKIDIQGEVLKADPPRLLSYTFKIPADKNRRERPTFVTFEIKAMNSMVKLRLTHEDLIPEDLENDPNTYRGLNNGWPAILSNLKSVLETGRPLPLII